MEKHNWASWFEIPVNDLERAKTFYETIFKTELQVLDLGQLKMALFPSGLIGGALVHHPEFYRPSSEGVLLYLNGNPDLSEILDRVKEAGGQVVVEKRMISPDHGYMGIFTDSEGNRLALHSNQ